MSNINDKATVSLFVNGEQAEQAMTRLKARAESLEKAIKAASDSGNAKELKTLRREFDKVSQELNRTESVAKGAGEVLNNLSGASLHGLRNTLKYLQKELRMTRPDTETWRRYSEQIKQVKQRIAELNQELSAGQSAWGRFKTWATESWFALDLVIKAAQMAYNKLREFVNEYADMDQEMADTAKFTDMAAESVENLNKEFKQMNTRTPRDQLNRLAQEAGKLGKSTEENVLGYVRAADKINVALDEIGDGATMVISKLTGVFGYEEMYGTEQSLLKVGSVVNDLSQNCRAAAPYLTNFTERMGGVGKQANMTIPQIAAYGAVLDSNAQHVESAATAMSQILVRMMADPAKYARAAGLEVGKFAELLKTDANEALLLFLGTLHKAGGLESLAPMFKDMGENGDRVIKTLSTLAEHIDDVRAQQMVANEAFEKGISIDKEFNIQNKTKQALIAKGKKVYQELRIELGKYLFPLMEHSISTGSAAVRLLLTLIRFASEHKTVITTVAASIAIYTAAIHLHNLALDAHNVRTKLATKLTTAWSIVQKSCSGVIAVFKLAVAGLTNAVQYFNNGLEVNYAMQQRWSKAMAAMKFSSWTGLVLALAAGFYLLYQRMRKSSEEMMVVEKIQKSAAEKVGEMRVEIDILVKAIQDETLSLEENHKAHEAIKRMIPGYNALLDEKTGRYRLNKKAVDDYIASLTRLYELEGAKDMLKEIGKEKAKAQSDITDAKTRLDATKQNLAAQTQHMADNSRNYAVSSGGNFPSVVNMSGNAAMETRAAATILKNAQDRLDKAKEKEAKILAAYGADLEKSVVNSTPGKSDNTGEEGDWSAGSGASGVSGGSGGSGGGSSAQKERFEAEKAWREKEETLNRFYYESGEIAFTQYKERINEIAVEYNQKLLDREDLTDSERLRIQADHWEAVNKRDEYAFSLLKEDEDDLYQWELDALKRNYTNKLKAGNLSAEEREKAERTYNEAVELAELEHLKRIVDLYEQGSAERAVAQRKYNDAELKALQRHQQQFEEDVADHEKRLADYKQKYFGLNADERLQEYNSALDLLTEVYNAEIIAAGDNAAERLRIEEAFQQAKLALLDEYAGESEERSQNALERAVAASVEWLNSDGGKAVTGSIDTLISGMSSAFSALSTLINAELDVQTAAIEARYNRESELAQGNSYKAAKLEEKKEKELAKVKKEANRKLFAMQIIQAVAQTAQNALNAYGSAAAIPVVGYLLAPIAAAMAIAAGSIQVAAIKKQQQASEAQGYSKGGFTKPGPVDEPAGVVHAGEWVASQKLLANPVARPMIEALDYAQRTNTIGSLSPEDVSRSITAQNSLVRLAESDGGGYLVLAAAAVRMSQSVENLNRRLDEPFVTVNTVTGDKGIKQAQDDYSRLMDNVTPKSKRK